jgi:hypothetical protein
VRRPRSSFQRLLRDRAREKYEEDLKYLGGWLGGVLSKKQMPAKLKSKIADRLVAKILKRHRDYNRFHPALGHMPADWDERAWRHLRKLYEQIQRYK